MKVNKNFYEILGVSKDATEPEIKKAYKKLALVEHPDRKPQLEEAQKEATTNFQEIVNAYEVLSDPDRRTAYDNMLSGGGGESSSCDGGGGESSSCDGGGGGSSSYRGKSKSHRQTRQRHYDETQNLASAQACLAQLLRSNGGSMGGNVLPKRYREMYGFDLYYFGYPNLTKLMKTVPGVVVHPNPTGKGFNSFTLSERSVPLYIQESIRYILGKQPESKISGSGFVHAWAKQYPTYPPFSHYWKTFGFSSQTKCIKAVSGVEILPGTPEYYLLRR